MRLAGCKDVPVGEGTLLDCPGQENRRGQLSQWRVASKLRPRASFSQKKLAGEVRRRASTWGTVSHTISNAQQRSKDLGLPPGGWGAVGAARKPQAFLQDGGVAVDAAKAGHGAALGATRIRCLPEVPAPPGWLPLSSRSPCGRRWRGCSACRPRCWRFAWAGGPSLPLAASQLRRGWFFRDVRQETCAEAVGGKPLRAQQSTARLGRVVPHASSDCVHLKHTNLNGHPCAGFEADTQRAARQTLGREKKKSARWLACTHRERAPFREESPPASREA